MPVEFFLTSSMPMDQPRFGNEAVGSKRDGDLKTSGQEACGKDSGSFDAALRSARSRRESEPVPARAKNSAAGAAKPAGSPVKNRTGAAERDLSPEAEGTIPGSTDSSVPGSDANLDLRSAGGNEAFAVVTLKSATAAETVMARPEPEDVASEGGQSADTSQTAAAAPIPGMPADFDPAAPDRASEKNGLGMPAPGQAKDETTATQGPEGGKAMTQTAASSPAPAVDIPATGGFIDPPATDTVVANDPARPLKIDLTVPSASWADRSPENSRNSELAAPDRGGLSSGARAGDFTAVLSASALGDGESQTFDPGPEGDPEPYCDQPQVSAKEAAKGSGPAPALQAAVGGYQENGSAGAAGSGNDFDQKAAELLQPPQRAVYGEGSTPAAAADTGEAHLPKDLRAETLAQIVDKAVFRLRDGQSQVRIDLKPESLGHVRLEIATENHQVTMRITAESHIAKDLIDSGLGQLKVDLQAQGLKVDEIEVSVAGEFNDFNRHQAFSDRAARGRRQPSGLRASLQEAVPVTGPAPALQGRMANGVDCFV